MSHETMPPGNTEADDPRTNHGQPRPVDPNLRTKGRQPQTGVWRGIAGCFMTFALAVIGTLLGGIYAFNLQRPPVRGGTWDALDRPLETVAGGVGGGVAGIVLGIVASVFLFRRR